MRVWTYHQDRLLLVNAAEVKQIGMLNKCHSAIGAGWHDVVGKKHGNGVGLEPRFQMPAVSHKQGGINGRISHWPQLKPIGRNRIPPLSCFQHNGLRQGLPCSRPLPRSQSAGRISGEDLRSRKFRQYWFRTCHR